MIRTAQTGVLTTNAGGDVVLRRLLVRVVTGESRGREATLEAGTLVIGSHPDADLQVSERTVSRFHAELSLLADGVRVRDLQSRNGTFVGDSRIESVIVQPPAEVTVGKTRIELVPADLPAPEAAPELTRFGSLVGRSAAMRKAFGVLESAVSLEAPVLIEGEAGTGKSAAARALHDASPRAKAPLVVYDATAPTVPFETALKRAAGGTLVLDRLEAIGASAAHQLVSALDRRERGELDFRPIGLSRVDLRRRVEEGALRRDLYFHVAAVRVVLPPLRERREDLPVLVAELAQRLGQPGLGLGDEELAPLRHHDFRGNVRELAHLVERSLSESVASQRRSAPPPPPTADDGLSDLPFKQAKEQLVDAFERRYVASLLERHDGNVSRAAQEAGLDRNYLARLARKHGLR